MIKGFTLRSVVSFLFLLTPYCFANGFLLKAPPRIGHDVAEQCAEKFQSEMRWVSAADGRVVWSVGFACRNRKTSLCIEFSERLPKEIADTEFAKLFIEKTENGLTRFSFLYGDMPDDENNMNKDASPTQEFLGDVATPLVVENSRPIVLCVSDLAEKIRNKRVVFYTGAGISAGVVPMMGEFMRSLSFTSDMRSEIGRSDYVKKMLADPEKFLVPVRDFFNRCAYGAPTQAHAALADMVLTRDWGVLTENVDLLHKRSGIEPLARDGANWLRNNVSLKDLKEIDYVITIGLASDESGFLAWYKMHNPNGCLVAINTERPPYLSCEEYLVLGDAQTIVPALKFALE